MAILSELPDARLARIFDHREIDSETADSIRSDIEEIREQGYVVGMTPRQDERCVAVPITTDDGRVLGALGVEASASQHEDSWFSTDLLEEVVDGAGKVEMNIKSMFLRDAWIESSTVRE